MSARIWIVSELYYPEQTSTGYYVTAIAEGLARRHEVHVLCAQPGYLARGTRAPRRERLHGVDVRRCAATRLDRSVLAARLLNMATLSLAVFAAALRHLRRGDEVLVVTTPPSLPFVAAAACRLRGARYTLLVHDVYPEILLALGRLEPGGWVARIARALDRRLYAGASRIVVLGRDMHELVAKKLRGSPRRIHVIPNWAEVEAIQPLPRERNRLLAELGVGGKIVVQYSGNMGHAYDLETLVECATRLRGDDRLHFLLIGNGAKRRWLEAELARRALRNVILLEPRPRAEIGDTLNACDLAVIPLVRGMRGISMPSRTYNVLAAGKPIVALAEAGSELAMLVEEENAGWVVPPQDVDGVVRVLLGAASAPAELAERGRCARAAAESKYRLEHAVSEYVELFASPPDPHDASKT